MFIDSHCHLDRLDLTIFDNDFSRCMEEIEKHDLEHLLCVAIDLESYPRMRALVDDYPSISVSVGVHPNEVGRAEPSEDQLMTLAADPRVVAIGETGLDYFRGSDNLLGQQERFRRHIQVARLCRKPLIIHTRQANSDTLRILGDEAAHEVGGVFHCFAENWETARQALDLNFYISLSGILTFKTATIIQDVARKVPADRLLIETDSPYLAPVPFRGKQNYPFHIPLLAKFLAELRKTSLNEIASSTTANYYKLFGRC